MSIGLVKVGYKALVFASVNVTRENEKQNETGKL